MRWHLRSMVSGAQLPDDECDVSGGEDCALPLGVDQLDSIKIWGGVCKWGYP